VSRDRLLLFDCDGVLADTEHDGHLAAFNAAFAESGFGVSWTAEVYAKKLLIGGGKERIASLLTPEFVSERRLPAAASAQRQLVARLHARKTELFSDIVESGALPTRPGVRRLVEEASAAGWRLAVASTSAEASVRAVLKQALGAQTAGRFSVFAGDAVAAKKPDPAIYRLALGTLEPGVALAIEDSRNGLLAAAGAGVPCIITVSRFTGDEDFTEAALVLSDLGDPHEPMRVIANRSRASPADMLRLADLELIAGPVGGSSSGPQAAPGGAEKT